MSLKSLVLRRVKRSAHSRGGCYGSCGCGNMSGMGA